MSDSKLRHQGDEGWIGVDLDGTLAIYDGWQGPTHIGEPIAPMVALVKSFIAEGRKVKIFTARVSSHSAFEVNNIANAIGDYTEKHIGTRLEATCVKDFNMITLFDDRCVQVEMNTGRLIGDQ